MDELEKYGLLSLLSILALLLVLTFARRDLPRPDIPAVAAEMPRVPGCLPAVTGELPLRVADPIRVPRPQRVEPLPAVRTVSLQPKEEGQENLEVPLVHVVESGDTLSELAQKYLGSARRWPELVALNGSLDPRKLKVGQEIRLPFTPAAAPQSPPVGRITPTACPRPSSDRHEIRPGDTLSSIALEYYGDAMQWKRIYAENRDRIHDARALEPGTILRLP